MKKTSEIDWGEIAHKLRSLVTPDRIVAMGALAIIPCLLSAWLYLPFGNKVGFSLSLSVPDILHTGQLVTDSAENYEQMKGELQDMVDQLEGFAKDHPEILEAVRALIPERA